MADWARISLLTSLWILAVSGPLRAEIQCEERADIVFLVDSSRSIRDSEPPAGTTDNWQLVLEFVVDAVAGLPIDNEEVKIGVLTYASEIDRDNRIHLGDYDDKDDLVDKVRRLPYIGRNTNTAAALKYAQSSMFGSRSRDDTRRVVILISDGISNVDHDDTVVNARNAKMQDDITIFTLGITKYANVGELEEVASDPAVYYHFYSEDFDHLNLLLDQLLIRLCKPKPPAVECTGLVADLTIILDSSGSIKEKAPIDDPFFYWKHLKNFAKKIVEKLEVSLDMTRVALIRFASKSKVIFHLDTFSNTRDIVAEIDGIRFSDSSTNTSGALRTMRKMVYREDAGDRQDVVNIGIVITDGESNVAEDKTEYEARRLHQENIRMFAVGVTDQINRQELETIVSEPVADHFFNTTRFEDIDNLVSRLVWRVCHEECILEETETGQSRCTSRTDETVCEAGHSIYWRKYPGHLLVGHNYARIDHVPTPGECQRLCIEDTRCRSVDYVTLYQECAVSYVTKDDDPRRFVQEDGVDYYEWICWDGRDDIDDTAGGESPGGTGTDSGGLPGNNNPTPQPGGGTETTTKKSSGSSTLSPYMALMCWTFGVLLTRHCL